MAIIKIKNPAIDLDAAEIPNIDASKITTGSLGADRIPSLAASKIGSGTFADARIAASNVSQHATSFDDNKIVNDISTLAIRQASNENKGAYNTNSMYVDVFQDDTGYTNGANTSRNASEFVSATSTITEPNTVSIFRPNTTDHSTSTSSVSSSVSGDSATLTKVNTSHSGNNLTNSYQKFSGSMSISSTSVNDGGWEINPTTDYNFGTNDFTIEAWAYNNNVSLDATHRYVMDMHAGGSSRLSIAINTGECYFGDTAYDNNFRPSSAFNSLNGFGNGAWTHYAWVKSSGNLALYSDGHRQFTYTDTKNYNFQSGLTGVMAFGQRHGSNSNGYMQQMYQQEIRVSDNARYSGATYTIPTAIFPTTADVTSATGNFTCSTITAPTSTSKMGAIITYQDNAGTNTLNTDIVLQLSADNGSNFTTATLTALPDFATGIKMAKVNDLSVTAGTQLKYKISFANQASGSKEARIRGVSLQY